MTAVDVGLYHGWREVRVERKGRRQVSGISFSFFNVAAGAAGAAATAAAATAAIRCRVVCRTVKRLRKVPCCSAASVATVVKRR